MSFHRLRCFRTYFCRSLHGEQPQQTIKNCQKPSEISTTKLHSTNLPFCKTPATATNARTKAPIYKVRGRRCSRRMAHSDIYIYIYIIIEQHTAAAAAVAAAAPRPAKSAARWAGRKATRVLDGETEGRPTSKIEGVYGNRGTFHKEPHGNIQTRGGDIWLLGRSKCWK